MAMALRIEVNTGKCCGYALCAELCPEVFGLDDQGLATVAPGGVPAGLEERARAAADACPQRAIAVTSDDG